MKLASAPARRAGWVKSFLAAATVVAALGTVGWAKARSPGQSGNPLAGHLLASPVSFTGRVVERIDAGSYGYLRVARDGGDDAWVVAVRPRVKPGDRVRANAVGRADHFHSKRLGRDFDGLFFAAVRAAE